MNQIVGVSNIPLWTTGSLTKPARDSKSQHDSESASKHLSIRHSITACAVLLAYIAIYMCVGFATLALVARAWLALFE
jgi:hypothetical protein